jgi:hypothetical protein
VSAIGACLEFLHSRKWLVELVLVLAIGGAIAWWHHSTLEKGIAAGVAKQKALDDRASAKLHEQVEQFTAQNIALAAAAHAKYEDDHAQTMVAASAPVATRELCKPAEAHGRSVGVSEASRAQPGDDATAAVTAVVREVPTSDHGQSDNRRRLLGALAALADEQTAVIREYQAREQASPLQTATTPGNP